MSYNIEDLYPQKPVLILNNQQIVLSLITLQKEVIFKNQYGSLQKALDSINEQPEELFNIIFELILDKSIFKNSLEVFKSSILSMENKEPIANSARKMKAALDQAVSRSMPLIRNVKRYKELKEIQAGDDGNEKPCYGSYFDTVAKRYGYTLENFYELTLGQLHILLKIIGDKSYEDLEVQAALAGKKLKPRMKFEDITEEQEEEQTEQAVEALKELQRRYQENKLKKGK